MGSRAVTLVVAGKLCRGYVPPTPPRPQLAEPQSLNTKEFVRNEFETNSPASTPQNLDSKPFNEVSRQIAPCSFFALSSPEMTPFCVKLPQQFPNTRAGRLPSMHNPTPAPNPSIQPPMTTFFFSRIRL